ncbi:MAG: ribosome maturation factor [Bacteroidota bacterium]
MVESQIEKLLLEKFEEEEYADCFIIEVMQNNKKLQVFIDSDSNIDFTKCRKISRYLEEHIEENNWLGEKYILEVSSPGIDRPLKFPRQYKKNVGRKIDVHTIDGEKITGTLIETNDEVIKVEYKVRIKEGKKKRTEIIQQTINYEDIKKAIIKFSFSK